MKNFILLILLAFAITTQAQYSTPGTGVKWTFDDLAANSGGVVVVNTDAPDPYCYLVNNTLTITESDTIIVTEDVSVEFTADTELVFNSSTFIVNPAVLAKFEGFGLIRINDAFVYIKRACFNYGAGFQISLENTGTFTADSCEFSHNTGNSNVINIVRGFASITNSKFLENYYPAIGSGANIGATIFIKGNHIEGNVTSNGNRPQLNIGPCMTGDTTKIIENTIIGNREFTMVGGISTSSLLGVACAFLIEGNKIQDNRYGITFTGSNIEAKVINNILLNNNTETNPNNGGSGINVTAPAGNVDLYASGNTIDGHLWGVTLIGNVTSNTGPACNFGNISVPETDAAYNSGLNIFHNNGNNNTLYDFYNNSPVDVMAQNNTWNAAVQDSASIETVIVHKSDNTQYGAVTFMPAYEATATYTVLGRIVNQGEPIEGATIIFDTLSVITEIDGRFCFENILNGNYFLTIQKENYSEYSQQITVTDSNIDLGDIELSLNINDYEKTPLQIYPNPVKNVLNILGQYSCLEIYDITGKNIYKQNYQTFSVDVSMLNKGIYIIKLFDKQHKEQFIKFVK